VQSLTTTRRLVSAARSYPFHFHLLRSLIHLASHTRLYIPLAPFLLPILTHTLAGAGKAKASTLKPLDLDTAVRAPQQYLKTRVYGEALADEAAFLLAEWLASAPVQGSIAFPELVVPVTVVLRKALKAAKAAPARGRGAGKEVAAIRALVERVEESAKWVEERRRNVSFAPSQIEEVAAWERGLKVEDAPLVKYVKVQRKAREKRRQLLEKVRV
jgi:nucleolar complex protein 2